MATTPAFVVRAVNLLKRELMEYQRDKNVRKSKLHQGVDVAFGSLGQPVTASAYISDCVDQLDEVCKESLKTSQTAGVDAVKIFQSSNSVDPAEFAESLLEFVQVHVKEHFAALAEQAARTGNSADMILFLGSLTHLKVSFLCYEQLYESAGNDRCVTVLKKCGRLLHLMILQYSRLTAHISFRNSLASFSFTDVSEYRGVIDGVGEMKQLVLDLLPKDVGGLVLDDFVDKSLMLLSGLLSTLTPVNKDTDRIRAFAILSVGDFCRLAAPVTGKCRLKIVHLLSAVAAIYSPLSSLCKVVFDPQDNSDLPSDDPAISWVTSVIDGSGSKQATLHLQLFELLEDSRCDLEKLLFVLIKEDFILSRLIVHEVFRKSLPECGSSFSSIFRCLVLISENNFSLWNTVFAHALFEEVEVGIWEILSKKEIWVSTKPAWFEAIVSFLDAYTRPAVADIVALLPPPTTKPTKISIKFEKMLKRVISTVTKQLSIIPLGLAKFFIELSGALPNDVKPVGNSVCLHFGICSTYRLLLSGEGSGGRSDADFVKNLLLAVGERLCLCSDAVYADYGRQIDDALRERLQSDHYERFLNGIDDVGLEVYCTTLAASMRCRKEDIEALQGTFRLLQRNRGWIERKLNIIQRVKGVDAEWSTFSLDIDAEQTWKDSLKLTEQVVFASKFPPSWNSFLSQMLRCQNTSRSGMKEMLGNRWEFKSGSNADADAVVFKAIKACDNLVN